MIAKWDVARRNVTNVTTTIMENAFVRKDSTSVMIIITKNVFVRKDAINGTSMIQGMNINAIVKTTATMITA
ncbi:hypothetical protein ACLZHR_16580 [Priestia aryabhattai]|uniref:hypothetical protein n=1 Tax=Priestia aryabhattai TaxID=412384 RepID=UPI003A80A7FA